MNQSILGLKKIDNKAIFSVIDDFQNIIGADYILYLEKNPVLD
jgi:hypothetical protein